MDNKCPRSKVSLRQDFRSTVSAGSVGGQALDSTGNKKGRASKNLVRCILLFGGGSVKDKSVTYSSRHTQSVKLHYIFHTAWREGSRFGLLRSTAAVSRNFWCGNEWPISTIQGLGIRSSGLSNIISYNISIGSKYLFMNIARIILLENKSQISSH